METRQFNSIQAELHFLINLEPESIEQSVRLGEGRLTKPRMQFQALVGLLKIIYEEDLPAIPSDIAKQIVSFVENLNEAITSAQQLSTRSANFTNDRNYVLDRFSDLHREGIQLLAPVAALHIIEGTSRFYIEKEELKIQFREEINKASSRFEVLIHQFDKKLLDSISKVESSKTQIDEILDGARKSAAEIGVTAQSRFFNELAESHEKGALRWLAISGVFLTLTIIYAVIGLFMHKIPIFDIDPTAGVEFYIHFIGSKLILFFVLAYASYASVRNFFSHKHNSVVFRQKETTLQTFKALAESTKNPSERDLVISHAASSVFGAHDTGFMKNADTGPPNASMIEILRSVGGGSS